MTLLATGAFAALGCQAIQNLLPTQPSASPSPSTSPSPSATVAPLTIPIVLPKPSPTPAPTPTPGATPTPAPSPTPPSGSSCSLPASNPPNPVCVDDPSQLYPMVDAAITKATQIHPEYFDFGRTNCGNCYYVTNVDGYVATVQQVLAGQGACSYWDGEELAVKTTNAFSEQFDILVSSGYIRRGPNSYRGDCMPSWF
ncbi:MAG TPA: hypothetical protein VMT70_15085 [Vicinamibacteria bacterium]|nr:hypothetical protein [Vicinamibacteria bacterium]